MGVGGVLLSKYFSLGTYMIQGNDIEACGESLIIFVCSVSCLPYRRVV